MIIRTLLVIAAVGLSVSACTLGGDGPKQRERTSGGTSPSHEPATTAAQALERAGLQLPEDAREATIEPVDLPEASEAYAVTFTLPRAEVEDFLASGDLGGSLPATALPVTHKPVLGDLEVTDGSRHAEAVWPEDVRWWRYALADPGDPSTIHVALQHVQR